LPNIPEETHLLLCRQWRTGGVGDVFDAFTKCKDLCQCLHHCRPFFIDTSTIMSPDIHNDCQY